MKFNEIIQSEVPVLVDFFADWCGPCKAMAPILADLKKDLGNKGKIIKIDVDKNPKLAAVYQIRSVPTLMIFKQGKMLWKTSGGLLKQQLLSEMQKHF